MTADDLTNQLLAARQQITELRDLVAAQAREILTKQRHIDALKANSTPPAYIFENGKVTPINDTFTGYICACHNCGQQFLARQIVKHCPGCAGKIAAVPT